MKKQCILIFILIFPISCKQNSTKALDDQTTDSIKQYKIRNYFIDDIPDISINKSVIAEIPFIIEDSSSYKFKGHCTKTQLTEEDYAIIEALLHEVITHYNEVHELVYQERKLEYPDIEKEQYLINLNDYRRQYIPIINSKGEKEVWVNCFCSAENNWRKNIVSVLDGGKCYFNCYINISKKKLYYFNTNGYA